MTDKPAGSLG